jgi:uncharacterized membrane protein YidH (DUF202 family)
MSRPPRPEHPADLVDAGLQSERTYLAWQRTGLSFAAAGALLVHAAGGISHPYAAIPGLFGLAAGALILARGLVRYRAIVTAARGEGEAAPAGVVGMVALAATLLTVAGLVIVALTRP